MKLTYTKNDDGHPLDGTIYDILSVGPLRFDDWMDGKVSEEETVLLATFPHPIILLRYVFVLLLSIISGVLVFQYSPEYAGVSVLVGVLYLLIGLVKYWSEFYVVTDDNILHKKGILFTKGANTLELSSISETEIKHSILARVVDLVARDFGDIEVSAYGSGDEDDITLHKVPLPSTFTKEIANQTYDDN